MVNAYSRQECSFFRFDGVSDVFLANLSCFATHLFKRCRIGKTRNGFWKVLIFRVAALLPNAAILIAMTTIKPRFFHSFPSL